MCSIVVCGKSSEKERVQVARSSRTWTLSLPSLLLSHVNGYPEYPKSFKRQSDKQSLHQYNTGTKDVPLLPHHHATIGQGCHFFLYSPYQCPTGNPDSVEVA